MLAHKRLPCVDVGQREIGDEGAIALIVSSGVPAGLRSGGLAGANKGAGGAYLNKGLTTTAPGPGT